MKYLVSSGLLASGAAALSLPSSVKHGDTSLGISKNIVTLERLTASPSTSSKGLRSILASKNPTIPLLPVENGTTYLINVDINGQTFKLLFDTGSSDTWVPKSTFQCVNAKRNSVPQKSCNFGPLFKGDFPDGQIPNENFNITYGDGEFLTGPVGCGDVTVAGLTVKRQEFSLVDHAYWYGDGINSGLIGFGYPALTSAFKGTDPTKDNLNTTRVQYNPLVTNAISQKLFNPPLFSVVIDRGPHAVGGQLALGGLPNITITSPFTTVPLEIVDLSKEKDAETQYSFYTILVDGAVVRGTSSNATEQFIPMVPPTSKPQGNATKDPGHYAIVDSGTTLVYFPQHIFDTLKSAFDPPPRYESSSGMWETDCNAKVPSFGVKIGGKVFEVDAKDVLPSYPLNKDPITGLCGLGIQPAPPSGLPNILGDVFMRNVVSVFDVGNSQMKFSQRKKY